MGMYTGLRCKVTIKKEYIKDIIKLEELDYEWIEHSNPLFKDFGKCCSRAGMIPCGVLCYMPDEWEKEIGVNVMSDGYKLKEYAPTDGFDRSFDTETGKWIFQCSLKNYGGEIDYFINEILNAIVEEVEHLEEFYEEWDTSLLYYLDKVSNIIKYKGEGICYR